MWFGCSLFVLEQASHYGWSLEGPGHLLVLRNVVQQGVLQGESCCCSSCGHPLSSLCNLEILGQYECSGLGLCIENALREGLLKSFPSLSSSSHSVLRTEGRILRTILVGRE